MNAGLLLLDLHSIVCYIELYRARYIELDINSETDASHRDMCQLLLYWLMKLAGHITST